MTSASGGPTLRCAPRPIFVTVRAYRHLQRPSTDLSRGRSRRAGRPPRTGSSGRETSAIRRRLPRGGLTSWSCSVHTRTPAAGEGFRDAIERPSPNDRTGPQGMAGDCPRRADPFNSLFGLRPLHRDRPGLGGGEPVEAAPPPRAAGAGLRVSAPASRCRGPCFERAGGSPRLLPLPRGRRPVRCPATCRRTPVDRAPGDSSTTND